MESQQISQPRDLRYFNFIATPLAPLGTKALIYGNPAALTSWAPHTTNGFYVGPTSDHYHCLRFYTPATRRFRFSDTWHLYPTHCQIPITLHPLQWHQTSSKALAMMYLHQQLRRSGMSAPYANSRLPCPGNNHPPTINSAVDIGLVESPFQHTCL